MRSLAQLATRLPARFRVSFHTLSYFTHISPCGSYSTDLHPYQLLLNKACLQASPLSLEGHLTGAYHFCRGFPGGPRPT